MIHIQLGGMVPGTEYSVKSPVFLWEGNKTSVKYRGRGNLEKPTHTLLEQIEDQKELPTLSISKMKIV